MTSRTKSKILYTLQLLSIVPLLILGISVLMISTRYFSKTIYREVEQDLQNIANDVELLYNVAYPGDYSLKTQDSYRLYKGDSDITSDYSLIDAVKEDNAVDITIFYQDTRILTTVRDSSDNRIVGTAAPGEVLESVLQKDEPHFYNKVVIRSTEYFAYYTPLKNTDDSIVGMIFVGKPCADVDKSVQRILYPLAAADVIITLLAAVCIFIFTKKLSSILMEIHSFLSEVSGGNLNATLSQKVLNRPDELGDIGRSALTMQSSIRNMVEKDTLTGLYNRRSGSKMLQQNIQRYQEKGSPFCVALADIDLFKKINDTYGHECGDKALQNLSACFRSHMHHKGFAARWGGEEFLLVYENAHLAETRKYLETLLEDIRSMDIRFQEYHIHITVTFGVIEGNTDDMKVLLRNADQNLYRGKSMGRNCIISDMSSDTVPDTISETNS